MYLETGGECVVTNSDWDQDMGSPGTFSGPAGTWLSVAPLFVNAAARNLRLRTTSPCIDAGASAEIGTDFLDLDGDVNIVEVLPLDLDLSTRVLGASVDMGAYERQ